jgi:hypothetical protein
MIKLAFFQEDEDDLVIGIISNDQLLFYGYNNNLIFATDKEYLAGLNYVFARGRVLKQFLIDNKL